jgi:hypothetical protein
MAFCATCILLQTTAAACLARRDACAHYTGCPCLWYFVFVDAYGPFGCETDVVGCGRDDSFSFFKTLVLFCHNMPICCLRKLLCLYVCPHVRGRQVSALYAFGHSAVLLSAGCCGTALADAAVLVGVCCAVYSTGASASCRCVRFPAVSRVCTACYTMPPACAFVLLNVCCAFPPYFALATSAFLLRNYTMNNAHAIMPRCRTPPLLAHNALLADTLVAAHITPDIYFCAAW